MGLPQRISVAILVAVVTSSCTAKIFSPQKVSSGTPSVSLTTYSGGQSIVAGSTLNINWTSSDADSGATVTLEYSKNSGAWTSITTGSLNDGTESWNVPTSDPNGTTYKFRASITNSSSKVGIFTGTDTTVINPLPTVTITTLAGAQIVLGGANTNITWTCADTDLASNPITIQYSKNSGAWTNLAVGIANSGTYTWAVPADPDGTLYKFKISATDLAAQTGTFTGADNSVDNAPPVFTAASFVINGGVSPIKTNTVPINLNVVDTLSMIQYVCFKDNNTAPLAGNTCWTAVTSMGATPATNLTLTGVFYTLDYLPGAYTVYAWAKDALGNISAMSAAGAGTIGKDKQNITYTPGVPASVKDIVVANTDSPSSPPTYAQMTAGIGSDVYIKWNITDDAAIPAGGVSLYYTTDESTFTLITAGLNNAINGACTIGGSQTGCYKWTGGSPTNSYYRIRVGVTDADSLASYGSGNLTNAGNFRLIAGNTDDGRLGSAQAAFFNPETYNDISDRKSLAVASDGTIYYNDKLKGVLKIDPLTGTATMFLKQTGTNAGDGGL